jgi:CxxC motif-containing protein
MGKINDVLSALSQTTMQLPVRIGDVIIPDVAGTGVDVVATANQG